jgi:starch synthase
MFAGSDFVMMPSRYEPCGLNQFYGMAYGAVPIVRSTGGLADAVEKFNVAKGTGDGFVFRDFTVDALVEAIEEAVSFFENDEAFEILQKQIMKRDDSWAGAARTLTDDVYA